MDKANGQLVTRRTAAIAAAVRSWRRLTGGRRVRDGERRTLVGCSGGADSSALLLALATATPGLVVGHVVHDLRPPASAEGDCRTAQALAQRLGLPFLRSFVAVRTGRGNAEARARVARYAALDEMARASGCPFVAVAHHQGDQAETLLMGLLRGAGARGLAGMAQTRAMRHATLVRPLLGISAFDCRRICDEAGWAWCEDATNADTTRLRAAVRHGLLPAAETLRPGASARIARTATILRDAAGLIQDRVETLWADGHADAPGGHMAWSRGRLRTERPAVLGELLRTAARRMHGPGLDRMGSRALASVVRAMIDGERHPRTFTIGRLQISVRADVVQVEGEKRNG